MINFSEKYDHKKFGSFLKNFLPEDFLVKNEELEVAENNEYFKKAILLGSVKSLDELVVIKIERKRSEKSRITITKELFKFLDSYGYSRALIITFSKKEDHYRFSFITSDLNWVGTKVNKEFSDPKRLSFLLGVGSKVHTATKHLIEQGKVTNFDDLYSRFNIEIINDEFYEHYKNLFINLKDKLEKDFDIKIKHFAFPFGTFDSINQSSLKILDKNYQFIHSGLRGNNKKTTKLIYRDAVNPEMTINRLKAFLIGNADFLYKRKYKKLNGYLN